MSECRFYLRLFSTGKFNGDGQPPAAAAPMEMLAFEKTPSARHPTEKKQV
jgi:hypothetical protein